MTYNEKRKAYEKAYRELNKEKRKSYLDNSREERLLKMKEYNKNNKAKIEEYRKNNINSIKEYQKEYHRSKKEKYEAVYKDPESRKEYLKTYHKSYAKERQKIDPAFKFIRKLRSRQNRVLKGAISTTAGLGCTRQELRDYLSERFQPGMTFDNHGWGSGKWHIDHVFPLSSFEEDENGDWKVDSEYNKLLIHFTNLQPLWHDDNLKKSNKIK